MDSSDASNVYITGLDEATTYTFLMGEEYRRKSETRRTPRPPQNIPDSPDISLNDVSFTSDCAHGDSLRRRQECHGFDVSWIPRRCHG
jgi:hypothetical protein